MASLWQISRALLMFSCSVVYSTSFTHRYGLCRGLCSLLETKPNLRYCLIRHPLKTVLKSLVICYILYGRYLTTVAKRYVHGVDLLGYKQWAETQDLAGELKSGGGMNEEPT